MSRKRHIYFITLILLTGVVGTASAQRSQGISNEFRKLEQYIHRVADLARTFQDDQARQFVFRAYDNLETARRLLFEDSPPRLTLAKFYMVSARRNADQAAKIILRKPLAYLKSQLDEKINQAEQAVSKSESDEAHYLLNQAKKYRLWAYSAFTGENLTRGQEYFRISYFFAQKCLEFVSGSGKDIAVQLEDLQTSIRQLLVEAEELVRNSGDTQLQSYVEDANRYFEEALQLAEQGDLKFAYRRMLLVKRLIYRIFDLADRDDENIKGRMENSLYSLRSFLQSLNNDVEDSPSPEIRTMLEQSWEIYRQAEQAFNEGDYAMAKSKIGISQRIANRILQLTRRSESNDLAELRQRADETGRLLGVIEQRTDFKDKPGLRAVFEEANRLLDLAYQAIERNQPLRAFQFTQTATRLTARLQREIQIKRQEYKSAELNRTYERLQNMIQRLRNSEDIPAEVSSMLDLLSEFLEKGRQSLEQGNLMLADEYFNTVNDQLKQITSKWEK